MSEQAAALVTGASGFCGRHLVAHLLAAGCRVAGLDRAAGLRPEPAFFRGDLLDTPWLRDVLETVQPQVIYHLAALTDPRLEYAELHQANALGTLSLLTAARQACPQATVLITGTSAVYGRVPPEALPIVESRPFQPANAYAVSKIAQEMVAYQQFARYDQRIIRTRAFNLSGPGESSHFVTSAFARQIAAIEAGRQEPVLRVGNLDSVRDFTDVRDAVRGYRLLAERGRPGAVYNLCSGQGTAIRQVLDLLLGLSSRPGIAVEVDAACLQPADVPIQIGDAAGLRAATGWSPAIPLRQTVQDVLDYWRKQMQEES